MKAFGRFAWAVLAFNVAVVAWGAFVRATGSGAGCGRHWPTCNGEVVPRAPAADTLIELTHRATSGLALVLVVVLVAWALRALPRGHAARAAAVASMAFMVVEALVGAALVLFGWVAKDTSMARAWVMPVHLTNTFLLLAALALTAAWSRRPPAAEGRRGLPSTALAIAALGIVLAGVTGAIAALGDTLFPAASLAEGLRQDAGGPLLLRLRALHPVVAALAALACAVAGRLAAAARSDRRVRHAATVLLALVVLQILGGVVNLALLAPVWMQLVHLVLADLAWIALVLLVAEALATGGEAARLGAAGPAAALGRG